MVVTLGRRRLRHIDRVRARKSLLQPLLQRLVELGASRRCPGLSGLVRDAVMRCSPGDSPGCDFAERPSMLDDVQTPPIQEGTETFMKHITCIEDLRTLHKRRVPKAFFDYADRGSYAEETLRANREDLQQIKLRQRILVDVSKRDMSTEHPGPALCAAPHPGAGRPARHAAWRRRNPRLPRGAGGRHSLHPEHDVDLLDRGYRGGRRQAVLVPALRDEGPRLHQGADRARRSRRNARRWSSPSTCR